MRFRVDLKIFLFLFIFYFTKQIEIYVMMLAFAILHELGHFIAGVMLKMKPSKIELVPYGVSISFGILPEDYNEKILKGNSLEIKKILVAIAGPMTNLIMIVILAFLNINITYKMMMIYTNLLLAIFNLLPIYPLDGGRILKGMLHIKYGKRKAEKYIHNITYTFLIVITVLCSVLILKMQNIAILIMVLVLWGLHIKEDIIYQRRNKIYNLLDKSIEIK